MTRFWLLNDDLTPLITRRAHELHEQRGRQGNLAVQDWVQAEIEIQKRGRPGAGYTP
jgi:hypothetical protein